MGKFQKWMTTLDGGNRTEKTAKQHRSEVQTMWSEVMDTCDVSELLDVRRIKNWVESTLRNTNKQPGTVASYLTSMVIFMDFMEQSKGVPANLSHGTGPCVKERRGQ